MKITKLKIKNLFGLKEFDSNGKDIEIKGKIGIGKTSILDAIRFALTNKSEREYIIHNQSDDGYVFIETDTGITIDRKKRSNKADYISVKDNNNAINKGTESFLRELFTPLQLDPVKFLDMDSKEQNRIILDLIDFKWDTNWIKEQFGEIVPQVNYEQNILRVLHDIQAENGYYFTKRESINRDARNKKAFVTEIADALPENYNASKWKEIKISDYYTKLEKTRQENREIEKAKEFISNVDNKLRSIDANEQIEISSLEKGIDIERNNIEQTILKLKNQIESYQKDLSNLESKKLSQIELIKSKSIAEKNNYSSKIEEMRPLSEKVIMDTSELEHEATQIETMKAFINEYERMVKLQEEIEDLTNDSKVLTGKIEKARLLPGEILSNANIPIENLTIEDGLPKINGLPISNLSEGQKLNLCIDIAKENKKSLNLLLIDGTERLNDDARNLLYKKCKEKGVQFIATRVTNDNELTIIEL